MSINFGRWRRSRMTDLMSITNPKHPEPFMEIPAQALLQDNCRVHCGMVRKENRFNNWQDRYLVLHKGCLYYYKDSTDKKAQGQFSLSGYRLSTAPEKTKYEWTFKLTHIQPEKRKYFFSAHSQKELNEWFEKIAEDMQEYCEPVTRVPEPLQDFHRSGSSCSSSGSGDDNDKDYDYPIVDPPDFNQIREHLKQRDSQLSRLLLASSIPEDDTTYCPPPPEFLRELNSSIVSPSRTQTTSTSTTVEHTEHENVTITGAGKASVDVSTILKRESTIRAESKPLPALPPTQPSLPTTPISPTPAPVPDTPPKPAPRKTSSHMRPSAYPTSEVCNDDRPEVPPRPKPPPKPLPRPPTTGSPPTPPVASDQCDEQDYLKIYASENDLPNPTPSGTSTLQRMRPDGNSFRGRHSETAPDIAEEVLPDSAYRLDLNKTDAIPLLIGKEGTYMIHSSRGGEVKKALSVFTGEKVKHFLLFKNVDGYALDPNGPRFKTKKNMLVYYHEKPLPNQDSAVKLTRPYTDH